MRNLLLASALLLAACGGGEKKEIEFDPSRLLGNAPSDSKPVEGGTLVWARGKDSTYLDPAVVTEGESVKVITNIFDTLVTFRPGSTELQPWLATVWEATGDGLVWTFTLRDDVQFHDGSPFNAEAVVFSFQRQADEKHPAHVGEFSYWQDNGKAIEKVEALSPTEVRFTLSRPYAPFLGLLAAFFTSIVSPAAWKSEGIDEATGKYKYDFARKPVGTGPFAFESWKRDEQIVLRANRGHFAGHPNLERIILRPVASSQTALQELLAGTIQGMDHVDPVDIKSAAREQRLRVLSRPALNVVYLAMNTTKRPFTDLRVRQAVAWAIDKKRIVKAAYEGLATPVATMLPEGLRGHLRKIDRKPDPAKAKALLAEAGYKQGFKVKLSYGNAQRPYMPRPGDVAIQIQQDLKEIGIDVTLDMVEWNSFIPMTQRGEHEMCLLGWNADYGDADNFLYVLLDKDNARVGSANNVSFYRGDRVHKLLLDAQQTYDPMKREQFYREVQGIVFDEAPVVPLATMPEFRILGREVRNYTIYPAGGEYFRTLSFAR